jgi:hypothetical protein
LCDAGEILSSIHRTAQNHYLLPLKQCTMKFKVPALLFTILFSTALFAQNDTAKEKDYFTVENYYKVKWGYADEFINLWKINHYPILKKEIASGKIISVIAEKPALHSGEDTRWDFKVTLVFKDAPSAFLPTDVAIKKQLYPNLDKLEEDEQHRFELLLAHWDVMVQKVPLE